MKLSALALLGLLAPAWADDAAASVVQAIDKAQEDRETHLAGYSVTEHYRIQNSRFDSPAEATVETTYKRGSGKSYRVTWRSGPSVLQTHVLDRLLKEEADMSRGESRKSALLISSNYEMKPVGQESLNGRSCDVVELTPRTKNAHLLKGRAWLDSETHVLVRIAGKPTASPAFLAGRPDIVRDYGEFDGFSLAQKSRAVTDSFLLGRTELTIEYTGYRINSAPSD